MMEKHDRLEHVRKLALPSLHGCIFLIIEGGSLRLKTHE